MEKEKYKKYEEFEPIFQKAIEEDPEWKNYWWKLHEKLHQKLRENDSSSGFMSEIGIDHTIERYIANKYECGISCAKEGESQLIEKFENHVKKSVEQRKERNTPEAKKQRKLQKTEDSLKYWELELHQNPNNNTAQVWVQRMKNQLEKLER